jgi:predicted lipid-binding transport protein (Tim44 family)
MALISLCGSILSCLLLGFGLYWMSAAFAAAAVFVVSLIALLIAAVYYIAEVTVALSSVRDEARDLRFMDLGNFPGSDGDNAS